MAGKLFICLALFFVAVCADEAVLTLTNDNFDQVITDNPLILVEFYAPWCGHCKKLAPEYEKAAEELGKELPLAKVDADAEANRPLAQRFGIRGFPTIKLFRNGEAVDYQGDRTAAALVSYMRKQAAPVLTVLTDDAIDTFSSSDKVVVIGFFEKADSAEYGSFKSAAEQLRDKFAFGVVVANADANKKYGVEKTPAVILFKTFDEGKNVLSADEFGELENFIKTNSIPLIDEIGPENYRNYMESGLPLAYLFVDLSVEGQKEANLAQVSEIAKQSKGKLNWVYIDWAKYSRHSERLGLTGQVVPALAIEQTTTGKHYAFDESSTISSETVGPWIQKFLAGELPPTIKSEPIPEKNDGPVKVLVAKSFDEIVQDSSKDVFVEFYAPWCGHCKKLAPVYEQLGEALKNVDSLVISKIDATANDVDSSLGIRGFPTLKLFAANNKTPVDYNGDRSYEDMLDFLHKHASVKFDLPAAAPATPKEEL